MGIRFYCEHCGKRLNVKSFLAGKKGICPKCGGKIRIPKKDQPAPIEGLDATPDNPPFVPSASSSSHDGISFQTREERDDGSHPERISAPSVPEESASEESFGDVVQQAINASEAEREEQPPDALWYIRPPSGEQYGPAEISRVERWIDEGRVSADTYVWREGWDEWRFAGDVFPGRFGDESAGELPAAMPGAIDRSSALPKTTSVSAASFGVETAWGDTGRSRTRSRSTMMIGLVALAVVAVVLAVTLVVIVL